MRAVFVALLVGALAIGAYALSYSPIRLTNVRPSQGFEPLTVKALLVIEPDAANRSVCVVVSSEDYATQSCGDVEGASERKTREITFKLPAGQYALTAILYQNTGRIVSANVVNVTVLSRTGAPQRGTHEGIVAGRSGRGTNMGD